MGVGGQQQQQQPLPCTPHPSALQEVLSDEEGKGLVEVEGAPVAGQTTEPVRFN